MLFVAALILMANIGVAQGMLELKVTNYEEGNGKIIVDIYNSEDSFLKHPYKYFKLDPINKTLTYEIDNLPNGTYAIKIYQDENNDRILNTGSFGSGELYGFSNNEDTDLKRVKFGDIKFEINSDQKSEQIISLSK